MGILAALEGTKKRLDDVQSSAAKDSVEVDVNATTTSSLRTRIAQFFKRSEKEQIIDAPPEIKSAGEIFSKSMHGDFVSATEDYSSMMAKDPHFLKAIKHAMHDPQSKSKFIDDVARSGTGLSRLEVEEQFAKVHGQYLQSRGITRQNETRATNNEKAPTNESDPTAQSGIVADRTSSRFATVEADLNLSPDYEAHKKGVLDVLTETKPLDPAEVEKILAQDLTC